ncbi:unnamed protein product [Arctia plantaginis]|uniref:Uncharacterized protein n=1 Tax=Arctia plantaginis TaxID=874455 RepID=A0A8S1AWJ0_ARCPL|nr:unnamed protein product [Arctia plantaginis]
MEECFQKRFELRKYRLFRKLNKMKAIAVFCLVAMFCSVLAKSKKDDNKVKIAVYYESLCPDSKAFIVQQLAPVWRDFRGVIKVKLVPYGKATHDKVDGKWQFNCHHGADECYGNKIQSCILKDRAFLDTEKMEAVICLMSQTNPDKSLDTCLTQVNKISESSKIKKCASGDQGSDLLAAYGNKTDQVSRPLSFVPTIIINEKFDQTTQDEAFSNLKSVVCRVAAKKPSNC